MKLNGSFAMHAPSRHVYDALLDPTILQKSIPGCQAAWWPDEKHMKVRLMLPLPVPGLQGPYDATVRVLEQEAPHHLLLEAGRSGRIGGTVTTVTQITLTDESYGSRLNYDSQIDFVGPIAFVGNHMFQDILQYHISAFFTNLNTCLTKLEVQ